MQSASSHARALARSSHTQPGEWAFGAGDQAITFVSRIDAGHYREEGRSWYRQTNGFGPTPGAATPAGTTYRIFDPSGAILNCFSCHSTGPLTLAADESLVPTRVGSAVRRLPRPGGGARPVAGRRASAKPGPPHGRGPQRLLRIVPPDAVAWERNTRCSRRVERAPPASFPCGERLFPGEPRQAELPDVPFSARADRKESGGVRCRLPQLPCCAEAQSRGGSPHLLRLSHAARTAHSLPELLQSPHCDLLRVGSAAARSRSAVVERSAGSGFQELVRTRASLRVCGCSGP